MKNIKLTEEAKDRARKDFEEKIAKIKENFEKSLKTGVDNFNETLSVYFNNNSTKQKAKVYFTSDAFLKMISIVMKYDKEVAWFGEASRGTEENSYMITDIIVYPQTITSSTVESEEAEDLRKWLGDRSFPVQGHSHVNMSTQPSIVDVKTRQVQLNGLMRGDFFISIIFNKRFEYNITIYDKESYVMFEPDDVEIDVLMENKNLKEYLNDSEKIVKDASKIRSTTENKTENKTYKIAKNYRDYDELVKMTNGNDDDDDYDYYDDYDDVLSYYDKYYDKNGNPKNCSISEYINRNYRY